MPLEVAIAAGLESVTADEAAARLGIASAPGPGLAIPYYDDSGALLTTRVRFPGATGSAPRFLTPHGREVFPYIPPHSVVPRETWSDSTCPINIVEGPIKALALSAHGFAAIGLGGVSAGGHDPRARADRGVLVPHPHLSPRVTLHSRPVTFVFDAGRQSNPQVAYGEAMNARTLMGAGANVLVAALPLVDGNDQGPDDFLHRCGKEAFEKILAAARPADPLTRTHEVVTRAETQGGAVVADLLQDLPWRASVVLAPRMVQDLVGHALAKVGVGRSRFEDCITEFRVNLAASGRGDCDLSPRLGTRWRSFTPAELGADPPPLEFIWENLLACGKVATLVGAGGLGKSALAVGLAVSRATGRPFLGRGVRAGKTVFVTTEDDALDYRRKLAAWRDHLGLGPHDLSRVAACVSVLDLAGIPFTLIKNEFGRPCVSANVPELALLIRERAPGADLIVLETVSRLAAGDETNSGLCMLVNAAEQLARLTGAAVLLIAHVSKDAARGFVRDAWAARGGGALGDNGRGTIVIAPIGNRNDDAVNAILGRAPTAHEVNTLLAVNPAKGFGTRPQHLFLVERVSTNWGLTLRLYPPAGSGGAVVPPPAVNIGPLLRALVGELTAKRVKVTRNKLRPHARRLGIPTHAVDDAVTEALHDGWLVSGGIGRGGGEILLAADPPPNGSTPDPAEPTRPQNSPAMMNIGQEAGRGINTRPPPPVRAGEINSDGSKGARAANSPEDTGRGRVPGEFAGEFGGEDGHGTAGSPTSSASPTSPTSSTSPESPGVTSEPRDPVGEQPAPAASYPPPQAAQ